jgi:hypothetical protein
MHYVFDLWMKSNHPKKPWCWYADDSLVHCKTEHEAKYMLKVLTKRFAECGLQRHPEKTRIIYCKDSNRTNNYSHASFDFLSFTFRPRQTENKNSNQLFMSFIPAVSNKAKKSMRAKMKQYKWHLRSDLKLEDIAKQVNPITKGWINYYGCYCPSAHILIQYESNGRCGNLESWEHLMSELSLILKKQQGIVQNYFRTGTKECMGLLNKSSVNREVQALFCERLRLQRLGLLTHYVD